jgi:predicted GNAT family N-acyltransferase
MTKETLQQSTTTISANKPYFCAIMDVFPINYTEKHIAELVHEIRRKVFVVEQHIDPLIEFDEHENESHHYLAYYKNKAAGTARWRETDYGIKMERFCVLKEYRNSGIGTLLVSKILEEIKELKRPIYLHAQTTTVRFYEKAGFKIVSELFYEANIPHFKMELIVS